MTDYDPNGKRRSSRTWSKDPNDHKHPQPTSWRTPMIERAPETPETPKTSHTLRTPKTPAKVKNQLKSLTLRAENQFFSTSKNTDANKSALDDRGSLDAKTKPAKLKYPPWITSGITRSLVWLTFCKDGLLYKIPTLFRDDIIISCLLWCISYVCMYVK